MTWQDINVNTNSTEWLGWWSEDWQGGWGEGWGQEVSVWAWGCTYGSRHKGSNFGIACAPTETSLPRRITGQWVTQCLGHLTAPNLSHWLPHCHEGHMTRAWWWECRLSWAPLTKSTHWYPFAQQPPCHRLISGTPNSDTGQQCVFFSSFTSEDDGFQSTVGRF